MILKNNNVIKNIFYLGIVQFSNYFLPFLTIPYISRIIGSELFGVLSFSQTIVSYFVLIVNFGFDYSATRLISINRDNKEIINSIFFNVFYSKIFFFIISTFFFLIIILIFPALRGLFYIHLITYTTIIGNVFLPTWLFQGLEKLKNIATLNFIIKVGYTVFVFVFLKSKEDFFWQNLSLSLTNILCGLGFFIYAIKEYELKFISIKLSNIKQIIHESSSFFFSHISQNLYNIFYVSILGIVSSNKEVAYFVAAQKVSFLFQTILLYSLSQALFPYFSKKINDKPLLAIRELGRILPLVIILSTTGSIIISIFSHTLIFIIYGKEFTFSEEILSLMAFVPVVSTINYFIGSMLFLNLKMYKSYSKVVLTGVVCNMLLTPILTYFFNSLGTTISWIIIELTMVYIGITLTNKENINIINIKYFNLIYVYKIYKKKQLITS